MRRAPSITSTLRAQWLGTLPNGTRPDSCPPFWPFGTLTVQQQRRHAAQVLAMRQGRLAQFPQALL